MPAAAHRAYSGVGGPVSELDLERFFFLDDDDPTIAGRRRDAANQLGFAVQLGTVRYLGSFLDDPTAVPGNVVEFVSRQLRIARPASAEWCFATTWGPGSLQREQRSSLTWPRCRSGSVT